MNSSLYKEVKNIVDEILDAKVPKNQIDELVSELSIILKKQISHQLDLYNSDNSHALYYNPTNIDYKPYFTQQPNNLIIQNSNLLQMQPFPYQNTPASYQFPQAASPFPFLPQDQNSLNLINYKKSASKTKKKLKSKKTKPKQKTNHKSNQYFSQIQLISRRPDTTFVPQNNPFINDSYSESDDEGEESDFVEMIYKVFLMVVPDVKITQNAILIVDLLLKDLIQRIIRKSLDLNSTRISVEQIESVVSSLYPGELAKNAVREGRKIVCTFEANQLKDHTVRYGFKREKVRQIINEKKLLNGAELDEKANVYLMAAAEYITVEILEVSGNSAKDKSKKIIDVEGLKSTIKNDSELNPLFSHLINAIDE